MSAGERKTRDFRPFFPAAAVSTIGSLAYKMALVAAGRFDAYFSWRSSHDWDIAAALLILEEAGGRATDRTGETLTLNQPTPRHQGLIAASPALHDHLVAISRNRLPAGSAEWFGIAGDGSPEIGQQSETTPALPAKERHQGHP